MSLIIRPLQDSDYDSILVKWWKDWGWEPTPKDFLPQDGKGGLMIMDEDEPVCAGFIYTTNSSVAWADWIVSSKTYRKKPERQQAIVLLVEKLEEAARHSGYKYLYALIKHKGLINTYKELGFVKGDTYNAELIKVL